MDINERGRHSLTLTQEEALDYPFVILKGDEDGKQGMFYDLLSERLGLSDDDMMDCREICVSKELQDLWYEYVARIPGARESLTIRLAMAGPKVSPLLHGFEVSWTDGFVVKKKKSEAV